MSADLQMRSAISEIEQLFRRFPDTPREIIVKIKLLSRRSLTVQHAAGHRRGSAESR